MTVFPYKNIMCICVSYITIYETYEYRRYRKIYIYTHRRHSCNYVQEYVCVHVLYIHKDCVRIHTNNEQQTNLYLFFLIHTYVYTVMTNSKKSLPFTFLYSIYNAYLNFLVREEGEGGIHLLW